MTHEVMNVKLCELDERIACLHSRVRLTETTEASALRQGWNGSVLKQPWHCGEN